MKTKQNDQVVLYCVQSALYEASVKKMFIASLLFCRRLLMPHVAAQLIVVAVV
jgi:hypothetical protein